MTTREEYDEAAEAIEQISDGAPSKFAVHYLLAARVLRLLSEGAQLVMPEDNDGSES
jgi:DNA-directed RNA polymerase subunit K/omega